MNNNQKGFALLEALFVILVICLLPAISWSVYHQNHKSSPVAWGKASKYETVLNYKIPLTSCSKVKNALQQIGGLDGDICYAATIKTTGESFRYVIVDQSDSYKERALKETAKNCTLDCGGSIPIQGPEDYIVHSNGRAEFANTAWTGNAAMALSALTGCPLPSIDRFENSGAFVTDNDRIGIRFSGKNIDLGSRYGNSCRASFGLIAYTSSDKPSVHFQNLAVQYSLQDPSSCASKDPNSSQANSDAEQCYSDQASMRGDISICDKTYFSGTKTDDSGCIHGVAERKGDPSICQMTFANDRNQCIDLANEAKGYFSGQLQATGL